MIMKLAMAGLLATTVMAAVPAQAETLRLLTWGSYAPDELVKKFEEKYPDITVEVTFSNNEEMIAKLRATGGAGFDLAQPSHDRIYAVQQEYNIYKPLDLSKINTDVMQANLLDGVKANTTIDGEVYAVPHQWGTSGLMANKSLAPDVAAWGDLCDPQYQGKTSMRLRRTILLGMAFDMGEDPFAAYADLDKYQEILDKVADKLIACKDNLKAYWKGGDDLSAMMMSGEIVASETWDSTAYKLYGENKDIVFVPPKTGALAWIDTFAIPRKGEADDAAYKWINFVLEPENVMIMSASTGAIAAVEGGKDMLPDDKKEAVNAAFSDEAMSNLKFFANIPAGVEDMEGKTLEKIKAATGAE
ncbi:MAG: extracellular solute-binding protein [Hoeflea sp.]|uniref:extracellular solute-binding protein n=1 Tax=Hoeflea sp. TaxID=1940281 RepID=UPI001D1E04E2|nr:extracellular solute-binding protein [Hoeflea sp.]MBU4528106.1 extracellular solute-binding protein [Alphaproteobacteria bacterium]MBU4543702.1 extracellular solute-binding protein [Alphaproteobacteria bacterium]MBU4548569.1 extracellular solute-binding protein [Alphaproteobacteria bacterium]MBV1725735.1 extracellular solute-binding protein [Hoeflea sp.]MBV1762091.1 extracellular solute-binding protein [Hoeflea sp.]